MLRLTELRLPLDHSPQALAQAICERLNISADALEHYSVFKRGHDARKRVAIKLVYAVDCTVKDEAAVLARYRAAHPKDNHVQPSPNMEWVPPPLPTGQSWLQSPDTNALLL